MKTFGKRTHGLEVSSGRKLLGRDRPDPVERMTKERREALRRTLEIAGRMDRDEPKSGSPDKVFIAVCALIAVVASVLISVMMPAGISGGATTVSEEPSGLP